MDLIYSIIGFLIAIGILVTFHEYGHFIVARFCNVKVLKFSVGFGKPIIKSQYNEDSTEVFTLYDTTWWLCSDA